MQPKGIFKKNKIVSFLLISGITFLLIVLLEVLLSVLGFGHDIPLELKSRYDKFRPDKDLVWALKKDWKGLELNGAPITTDFYGLRKSGNNTEGNYKILFLGDSVTYGHLLGDLQTIPAILQASIAEYTNSGVRVINGAVPGYSTFQSLKSFQSLSTKLMPDLVLLGFCLNDVTERYLAMSEYGGNRFFMINVDTTSHLGFIKKSWANSATRAFIIWLLKKRSKYNEIYQVKNLWQRPTSPEIVKAWEQVFSELEKLILAVQNKGIKLAVIIYPYKEQLKQTKSSYPQDILGGFLNKHSIHFLDLLPIYSEEKIDLDKIFMDSNHFTPLGSARTALYIHKFLLDNKLIPVGAPSVNATSIQLRTSPQAEDNIQAS